MATVVKINGSTVSCPRPVLPRRLVSHAIGSAPTFSFAVRGGAPRTDPDAYLAKPVEVVINGTTYFKGESLTRETQWVNGVGWAHVYNCVGLRHYGDLVAHTDSNDGSDVSAYNLQPDVQNAQYLPGRAGRTVGQIIADVLTMKANAAALDAYGLGNYSGLPSSPALPSATTTDLSALTLIPPSPVYVGGERLLTAIEGLLQTWSPNTFLWVDPDTAEIRFTDRRDFTPQTLTWHTDPVWWSAVTRDTSPCFSRVKVRGEALAVMAALRLSLDGINESLFAWGSLSSSQAKAAWVPENYRQPGLPGGQATASCTVSGGQVQSSIPVTSGGYGYGSAPSVVFVGGGGSGATATASLTGDAVSSITRTAAGSGYSTAPSVVIGAPTSANSDAGTCSCLSTTSVRVTSANKATRWASNYWDQSGSGAHGTLLLIQSVTSGVTAYYSVQVTANTALTPGGTSDLTLATALPHTNFDNYVLTGQTNNAGNVYTLYQITDSDVAAAIAPVSSFPFSLRFGGGSGVMLVSTPMGQVIWSATGNGLPPYNEAVVEVAVDRSSGAVRFAYPTYLTAGGEPDDVIAYVPVYVDNVNVAVYPPDSGGSPAYAGTYYDVEGVERTLTVTVRGWRDPANLSAMTDYAEDLHASVCDTVVETTVEYKGLYEDALLPGLSLTLEASDWTTGLEGLELPVVETTLEWSVDGLQHRTHMRCSNRTAHLSAEAYLKPSRTGGGLWSGELGFGTWGGGSLPPGPDSGPDSENPNEGWW